MPQQGMTDLSRLRKRPLEPGSWCFKVQSRDKKHAAHPDTRSELKPLDRVSRLG